LEIIGLAESRKNDISSQTKSRMIRMFSQHQLQILKILKHCFPSLKIFSRKWRKCPCAEFLMLS
jgi:hypothetical protein